MLDENAHAFFNHSSIMTEVTSSNDKMATVHRTNSSLEFSI